MLKNLVSDAFRVRWEIEKEMFLFCDWQFEPGIRACWDIEDAMRIALSHGKDIWEIAREEDTKRG